MEARGPVKNVRRFAAKGTFFLKWPRTIHQTTNAPSTLTSGSLLTAMRRRIGVIKPYSKRDCVWKRKRTAGRPWPVFIRFWKREHGPIGLANSFGSTKLDLTPASCWKEKRNGNRRPQSTKNSRPLAVTRGLEHADGLNTC